MPDTNAINSDSVGAIVSAALAEVAAAQDLAALRGIPILALYGDFIEQDPRWTAIRNRGTDFFSAAQNAGARVEVLDLPDAGIAGNSHLMMMERNNGAVAARVQEWLAGQGLWRAE